MDMPSQVNEKNPAGNSILTQNLHLHSWLYGGSRSLRNLLSNFSLAATYLGEGSSEFLIWKSGHSEKCQKNFDGSSGSMEMHATYILWNRSISVCAIRYTTILCDGDAKTHQHLNEKTCMDMMLPSKKKSVNHVAKRWGTALRNKIKEWRVKCVTLGGRKQGSLTYTTITKLQNFYRKAIVDNVPEVDNMKTSILTTLFHCMSLDAKPMHSKCPEGKLSWCFYNRDKTYNKVPEITLSLPDKAEWPLITQTGPVAYPKSLGAEKAFLMYFEMPWNAKTWSVTYLETDNLNLISDLKNSLPDNSERPYFTQTVAGAVCLSGVNLRIRNRILEVPEILQDNAGLMPSSQRQNSQARGQQKLSPVTSRGGKRESHISETPVTFAGYYRN
ncbi:uncharacterized protein TNCV_2216011 [Trichonephila clavipes]|nr:uncharacterized protein TNCV_2216011 [Trichonephila clavipes]